MVKARFAIGCAWLACSGAAWAGETPLYQPVPAWVAPLPPGAADAARADDSTPMLMLLDSQRRFEKGRVWSYVDSATRIASPEVLGQAGTLTIPWSPDQGDLVVHRVEILRGSERIDILRRGERFEVLRREEALEQREFTGLLTATLPVQGLQVGDVLRVAFSVTATDPALKGRVQMAAPLMAAPFRAGFARTRLSWPAADKMIWRLHGEGAAVEPRLADGWRELTLTMPLPKQPEMPGDAPARFRRPPMLEATSFADWADMSRVMAPLYATDGLIAPGSPLDREAAAIMASTPDPLARTQRALELTQDKVRYLLMGMAGGNYTPQSPARTWELRYGDCKAKTLLLVALLRRMGVEAEAVVASVQGADLVAGRLPMPATFDHVLVRATVNGETLWLDGTKSASRLADIRDTPPFRHVLPLRPGGAELMPLPMRANARPDMEVSLDLDESASVDLPSLFRAELSLRGPGAALIGAAAAQADTGQKREMVERAIREQLGEAQLFDTAVRYDASAGIATLSASGLTTTPWKREEKRFRRPLDRAMGYLNFQPDRARPVWRNVPVATEEPGGVAFRTRIKLPDGGRGYVLEGERELTGALAGMAVRRRATLADGMVTVEERVDSTGAEIAPGDVAAERARVTLAKAKPLRLIAPADAGRRWTAGSDPARIRAIEAAFAKAIAADPDEVTAYQSRASFRAGVLDWRGAAEDLASAIAIEPSVDLHLRRSGILSQSARDGEALAEAEAAQKLDPASTPALLRVAELLSERGDAARALALVQERVDLGGEERFHFLRGKADIQARTGDKAGAIATLDAAITEKPGDPSLLNARCWAKATLNVALDTALKDCTKAIELSDHPAAALDSRAMVYFRLNRSEEALADLDAALEEAPQLPEALFMRGVVRKQAGRAKEGEADLATARLLSPRIERDYRRFGIAP